MVCEWGMSDKMGPLTFGKKQEQIFLGREFAQHKDYSEKTAGEIDAEVRRIITERYEYATRLLTDNKPILIKVAEALLERETLGLPDLDAIISGKELPQIILQADIQKPLNLNPEDGKDTTAGKSAAMTGINTAPQASA